MRFGIPVVLCAINTGIFFCSSALASFSVGNGGDLVKCGDQNKSAQGIKPGIYSLDYLLTVDRSQEFKTFEPSTLTQSLQRILFHLNAKVPSISKKFEVFMKNYKNTSNFSEEYLWDPAKFGLIELKDERIVSLPPKNCLKNGKLEIIQAIVRQVSDYKGETKVVFRYDPTYLDSLEKSSPLQLSYLLVHEWLWNYTSKVEAIRLANWLLHSDAIEKMPADRLVSQLKSLGLAIPDKKTPQESLPVCDADPFGLDILTKMAASRSSGNMCSGALLAKYYTLSFRRSCNDRTGCSEYFYDRNGSFSRMFLDLKYICVADYLADNRFPVLEFKSNSGTNSVFQFSTNVSNSGKLKHVEEVVLDQQSMHFQITLTGTMSRECLLLQANKRHPVIESRSGIQEWYEDKFVIYSKFRLDNR